MKKRGTGKLRKKGLSPVIATVLLVSIAVILAVIIFFWARHFVAEKVEKEGQAIELLCDDVSFSADAYGFKLYVENTGSVPLYGMEIKKKGTFGTEVLGPKIFEHSSLPAGETGEIDIAGIGVGERLVVVPILLGTVLEKTKKLPHVCDEDYGVEIYVGE
ncbi:MAG: archaellin/type IV pilin N-terminal domain-containing protein [archaeon]